MNKDRKIKLITYLCLTCSVIIIVMINNKFVVTGELFVAVVSACMFLLFIAYGLQVTIDTFKLIFKGKK